MNVAFAIFPEFLKNENYVFPIILNNNLTISMEFVLILLEKYMCFVTRRKTTHFENKLTKIDPTLAEKQF